MKEEFRVCKKFVILNFSLCFCLIFHTINKSKSRFTSFCSRVFALVLLRLLEEENAKKRRGKKERGGASYVLFSFERVLTCFFCA